MPQAAPNYRATPDLSGHRSKAPAASPLRSGPRPSGRTGCATGSPRTCAPPWPEAAETCRPTGADAPEWPRASAAGFSAAPTFPSLSSFLLSVRMCARNISTVKPLAGPMHGFAVVRGSKNGVDTSLQTDPSTCPASVFVLALISPSQIAGAGEVAHEDDAENSERIPGDDEQRTVVETVHGVEG